jgi:hypothetical protein
VWQKAAISAKKLAGGMPSVFIRGICAGRPALKEVIAKLMLENRLLGQERSRFRIQCVADGARQGR